jgi:DNA-binding MarR family transcriptional regulator
MDEREFELINIIGGDLGSNQRDISRLMDLSLGMTNMLIRRLVTKGYIRISQLNKRKVQYLLTPKGFAEKMRKSVRYTLKTIHSIGLIKRRLASILRPVYEEGVRKFYVVGKSDLAGLIDVVLREEFPSDYQLFFVESAVAIPEDGVLLLCQENSSGTVEGRSIDMVKELAKDEAIVYQGDVEEGVLHA